MKDINKRHIRGFLRNYINKKYILENIELLEPKDATLEDYGYTLQDIVDIIISTPLEIEDEWIEKIKKNLPELPDVKKENLIRVKRS